MSRASYSGGGFSPPFSSGSGWSANEKGKGREGELPVDKVNPDLTSVRRPGLAVVLEDVIKSSNGRDKVFVSQALPCGAERSLRTAMSAIRMMGRAQLAESGADLPSPCCMLAASDPCSFWAAAETDPIHHQTISLHSHVAQDQAVTTRRAAQVDPERTLTHQVSRAPLPCPDLRPDHILFPSRLTSYSSHAYLRARPPQTMPAVVQPGLASTSSAVAARVVRVHRPRYDRPHWRNLGRRVHALTARAGRQQAGRQGGSVVKVSVRPHASLWPGSAQSASIVTGLPALLCKRY